MKKIIFISIMLFGLCKAGHGQVKVIETGDMILKNSVEDNHAAIGIGTADHQGYISGDYYGYKMGVHSYMKNSIQGQNAIGIMGEASQTMSSPTGYAAGVWGFAKYGAAGKNFGVIGSVIVGDGAGIYGTVNFDPCFPVNGQYAGFFDGHTYVDGNLTAWSVYNPSDMRLKENVISLADKKGVQGHALDNLLALDVIEYDLKNPRKEYEIRPLDSIGKFGGEYRQLNKDSKKNTSERRHYGVSAQELQKIYPDLVLEGQDGYLAVNYTEMVPLLIRSIQELKAELDEVKGSDVTVCKAEKKNIQVDNEDETLQADRLYLQNAKLYQNTPNPFTERTEIRFTLPDDAQNAYIYIFDMQGKMLRQIPVDASMQSVTINGYELSAGIYLYSLAVNGQEIDTKRMILSK